MLVRTVPDITQYAVRYVCGLYKEERDVGEGGERYVILKTKALNTHTKTVGHLWCNKARQGEKSFSFRKKKKMILIKSWLP